MTFRAPSLPGSSQQDSPSLAGWGLAVSLGELGETSVSDKPLWDRLRSDADRPSFEEFGIPAEAIQSFYLAMGAWIYGGADGFWEAPDSRQGHCDPEEFVRQIAMRFYNFNSAYNGRMTQSPIEDRLLGALVWLDCDWAGFPDFDMLDGPEDEVHCRSYDGLHYFLTPQAKLAGHKVDFLLWFAMGTHRGGIAIECDGHEFHEKNKEQAARDKRRDREILAAGYPVMRFTGSEIFRDAIGCAEQIHEPLSVALNRVSEAGGLFGPGAPTRIPDL